MGIEQNTAQWSEPVPPPDTDARDLQLLTIFHYVVAGVTGLFALTPLIYVAMGMFFFFSPEIAQGNAQDEQALRLFGVFFAGIGIVTFLIGVSIAILIAWAGRCLATRRRHLFCMVIAGIQCFIMPFGTVLGIFTLFILSRDSVRAQFDAGSRRHA